MNGKIKTEEVDKVEEERSFLINSERNNLNEQSSIVDTETPLLSDVKCEVLKTETHDGDVYIDIAEEPPHLSGVVGQDSVTKGTVKEDGDDIGLEDGDDSVTEDGDDSVTVERDDSVTVERDDSVTVERDDSVTVERDDSVTEERDDSVTEDGDVNAAVAVGKSFQGADHKVSNAMMKGTRSTSEQKNKYQSKSAPVTEGYKLSDSDLKDLVSDDQYSLLRAAFLARDQVKDPPQKLSHLITTNRLFIQLFYLKLDVSTTWNTLIEWLVSTKILSENTEFRRLTNVISRNHLSALKRNVRDVSEFLDQIVDVDMVTPLLSSIGLTHSNFCCPPEGKVDCILTNKIVLDLHAYWRRGPKKCEYHFNNIFTWLRKFPNFEPGKLNEMDLRHCLMKLRKVYTPISKSKLKKEPFLAAPFVFKERVKTEKPVKPVSSEENRKNIAALKQSAKLVDKTMTLNRALGEQIKELTAERDVLKSVIEDYNKEKIEYGKYQQEKNLYCEKLERMVEELKKEKGRLKKSLSKLKKSGAS